MAKKMSASERYKAAMRRGAEAKRAATPAQAPAQTPAGTPQPQFTQAAFGGNSTMRQAASAMMSGGRGGDGRGGGRDGSAGLGGARSNDKPGIGPQQSKTIHFDRGDKYKKGTYKGPDEEIKRPTLSPVGGRPKKKRGVRGLISRIKERF